MRTLGHAQVQCQIVGQAGDLVNAQAGFQGNLVLRDDGAGVDADHADIEIEILERLFQQGGPFAQMLVVLLVRKRLRILEQRQRRQLVILESFGVRRRAGPDNPQGWRHGVGRGQLREERLRAVSVFRRHRRNKPDNGDAVVARGLGGRAPFCGGDRRGFRLVPRQQRFSPSQNAEQPAQDQADAAESRHDEVFRSQKRPKDKSACYQHNLPGRRELLCQPGGQPGADGAAARCLRPIAEVDGRPVGGNGGHDQQHRPTGDAGRPSRPVAPQY